LVATDVLVVLGALVAEVAEVVEAAEVAEAGSGASDVWTSGAMATPVATIEFGHRHVVDIKKKIPKIR